MISEGVKERVFNTTKDSGSDSDLYGWQNGYVSFEQAYTIPDYEYQQGLIQHAKDKFIAVVGEVRNELGDVNPHDPRTLSRKTQEQYKERIANYALSVEGLIAHIAHDIGEDPQTFWKRAQLDILIGREEKYDIDAFKASGREFNGAADVPEFKVFSKQEWGSFQLELTDQQAHAFFAMQAEYRAYRLASGNDDAHSESVMAFRNSLKTKYSGAVSVYETGTGVKRVLDLTKYLDLDLSYRGAGREGAAFDRRIGQSLDGGLQHIFEEGQEVDAYLGLLKGAKNPEKVDTHSNGTDQECADFECAMELRFDNEDEFAAYLSQFSKKIQDEFSEIPFNELEAHAKKHLVYELLDFLNAAVAAAEQMDGDLNEDLYRSIRERSHWMYYRHFTEAYGFRPDDPDTIALYKRVVKKPFENLDGGIRECSIDPHQLI